MTFSLDPEVADARRRLFGGATAPAPPPVGDIATRRKVMEAFHASVDTAQPVPDDVVTTDFQTTAPDGAHALEVA